METRSGLEIDKLIEELEKKKKSLKAELAYMEEYPYVQDDEPWPSPQKTNKQIAEVDRKILEFKKDRANSLDRGITNENTNLPRSVKLGDILIIPGICIIIGNYAMSDYNTYEKMMNLFEKGIELYITEGDIRHKKKLLSGGQFSSGLNFLYAVVQYISTKHIKQENGIYEIFTDKDFASYFKDAGRYFDFINKKNSDLSDKKSDYWRGPRNHCKKILSRCSDKISIDSKEGGKKGLGFLVREV